MLRHTGTKHVWTIRTRENVAGGSFGFSHISHGGLWITSDRPISRETAVKAAQGVIGSARVESVTPGLFGLDASWRTRNHTAPPWRISGHYIGA